MSQAKQSIRRVLWEYLMISIGSCVYAVSISLFLDPNGIVPGGFTGLAVIVRQFFPGLQTGTAVLILNLPIIILGIWKFKLRFLASTIYSVLLSSVMMNLLNKIGPLTKDPLLACVAGGCLMAIGLEWCFIRARQPAARI